MPRRFFESLYVEAVTSEDNVASNYIPAATISDTFKSIADAWSRQPANQYLRRLAERVAPMTPIEELPIDQARDRVRELLAAQAGIVELATGLMGIEAEKLERDDYDTASVISVLMRGVATSMRSVLLLTASFDMSIRDCFGIARSIFESSVNIAYIATVGPPAALRAKRHAMQKAYRDLLRTDPAELKIPPKSPPPSSDMIPGMPEALGEFTRVNGTELTDWANLGVSGKLAVIFEHYPGVRLTLSVSLSSIYRDASEILHGTLYAARNVSTTMRRLGW